ncbi:MAG: hypothetical protein R3F61_34680 [Myxococcota bacterium]
MERALIATSLALALCVAPAAYGKDLSGRFGIGADSSLGFFNGNTAEPTDLPGLSLVYHATKIFGVQLILNTDLAQARFGPGNDRFTNVQFGVGVRGLINVALTDDVNLSIPIGVTAVHNRFTDNVDFTDDVLQTFVATEVGLRPEWFLVENLSIHTQVGIVFSVLNEDDSGFSDGGVHVNVFGAGDLLGNAGFTFYF